VAIIYHTHYITQIQAAVYYTCK